MRMNGIKVSVIIPVYKVPLEYLRTCLDSLVAQTMHECEFIVVSDGAPEAECSICEEYVARDCRFKFFSASVNGVLFFKVSGEYLSLCGVFKLSQISIHTICKSKLVQTGRAAHRTVRDDRSVLYERQRTSGI